MSQNRNGISIRFSSRKPSQNFSPLNRLPEIQDVPRADGDVGVAQRQGQRPQQRLVRHRPPRLQLRAQLTQVLYLLPLLPAEIDKNVMGTLGLDQSPLGSEGSPRAGLKPKVP